MKKYLALAIAATLPLTAHAVKNGNNVSSSDYKDYIVRFQVPTGANTVDSCGGLLIGGEYILTAAHCIGEYNYDAGYVQYIPYVDGGVSNSISVYQGVSYSPEKTTSTTYSVVDLIGDTYTQFNADAVSEANYVLSNYPSASTTVHDAIISSGIDSAMLHDVALLKLASKVSQKTHAALMPVYDSSDDSFNIAMGDSFTFRGWGQTDSAGTTPSVMQSTEVNLNLLSIGQYKPDFATLVSDSETECDNSSACQYTLRDYIFTQPTTVKATASLGDSGTPLTNGNDEVFSLLSQEVNDDVVIGDANKFSLFTWYLPYIESAINKVVAPSTLAFSNSDSSKTTTFKVQNLSGSTETLSPYVQGTNSDLFSVSGCNASLASMEYCDLTVTYSGSTNGDNATVYLGDSNNTGVNASYTVTTSSDNSAGGESGGGGSLGLFSFIGLLGFAFLRRKYSI